MSSGRKRVHVLWKCEWVQLYETELLEVLRDGKWRYYEDLY